MIKIINDNGMIWCMVTSPAGKEELEKYDFAKQGLVTFYDCRYEHTQYGQFVSNYYVSTILERHQDGSGLDLCGYVPAWKISGEGMKRVIAFLERREEFMSKMSELDAEIREAGIDPLEVDLDRVFTFTEENGVSIIEAVKKLYGEKKPCR